MICKSDAILSLCKCIKGMNGGICVVAGSAASGKTLFLCRLCEAIIINRGASKDRIMMAGFDNFFDLDRNMLSSGIKYRVETNSEIAHNRLAAVTGDEIEYRSKCIDSDVIADVIDGQHGFMDSIQSLNVFVGDLIRRNYSDIVMNVEFNSLNSEGEVGMTDRAGAISVFMNNMGSLLRSYKVNLYITASIHPKASNDNLSTNMISGGMSVAHGADIIVRVRKFDRNIRADIIKHRRSGGMSGNDVKFEFPIPVITSNYSLIGD